MTLYLIMQISMIAPTLPVKTMEPVKTLSMVTNANVFLDSMGHVVKTVCSMNSVSDKHKP